MQSKSISHETKSQVAPRALGTENQFLQNGFNGMSVITIQTEAFQQLIQMLENLINNQGNKTTNSDSQWLTGEEVMKLLDITSRTLQNYRDSGLLGFSQIGRKKIFYRRADVEALLEKYYHKQFKK